MRPAVLTLRKFFIIFIKFCYLQHICKSFWKIIKYVANKFEFIFIQKSIVNNIGNSKIAPPISRIVTIALLKAEIAPVEEPCFKQ